MNPHLYLPGVMQSFSIFIDDQAIYKWGDLNTKVPTRIVGQPWHLIPIQKEWLEKEIIFLIYSPVEKIGIFRGTRGARGIRIGEPQELTSEIFKDNVLSFMVATTCIFLGLFSIIFFTSRKTADYLFFGIFSINFGLYLLSFSKINQILFVGPIFWSRFDVYNIFLAPVFFILFLSKLYGQGYKKFAIPIAIHTLAVVALLFCDLSQIVHIRQMQSVLNFLLLLTLPWIGWLSIAFAIANSERRGKHRHKPVPSLHLSPLWHVH